MNLDKLRTVLANERTYLAYVRTALSAVVFGLVLLKFFPADPMLMRVGVISLVFGFLVLAWGTRQYYRRHQTIRDFPE